MNLTLGHDHDSKTCPTCLYGENVEFGFLIALFAGLVAIASLKFLVWIGLDEVANSLEYPFMGVMILSGIISTFLYRCPK